MLARYQARYTEVLINLLENEKTKPLIDKALSTYPLYEKTSNNEYIPNFIPTREEINKAILDYYKYREIGFETVGRFLDELEIAMNEIMPYYNQLMFSLDQDYDIKFNVDYTRNINRDTTGTEDTSSSNNAQSNTQSSAQNSSQNNTTATDTTSDNSTVNNYNKHVSSKTPQDSLSITNENIDSVSYADEVSWNHDTNTDNATHTGNSTSSGTGSSTATGTEANTSNMRGTEEKEKQENEVVVERTKGNYGQVSVQTLIEKYRDLILNIKQDIIKDRRIAELFMTIY